MIRGRRHVYGIPVSSPPVLAPTTMQSSVSQYGITWTFDQPYPVGQFVNGDYFVVGPVTITEIDPLSVIEGEWTRNGSMINPHTGMVQGYDSEPESVESIGFNAANNVGRPGGSQLSAGNPLVVAAGESLLSSMSRDTPGNRQQLVEVSVLTVLSAVPPANSFRPPYTNVSKAIQWNKSDIQWATLAARQADRLQLAVGDRPNPATVEATVRRAIVDHAARELWYRLTPHLHGVMYGREVAKRYGDAALTIMLNFPQAEIEDLVVNFIQHGIDLYGLALTGQWWPNNGGIFHGRKAPVVFASWLLDDENIAAVADASTYFIFMEDHQTNYVTQNMINDQNYTQAMLGMPEWSIRFASWLGLIGYSHGNLAPDASWGTSYRSMNIGMAGPVLAARIAGLENRWGWPSLFEYIDRAYNARSGGPGDDPMGEHSMWQVTTNGITALTAAMWEEFRDNYGPIWAP